MSGPRLPTKLIKPIYLSAILAFFMVGSLWLAQPGVQAQGQRTETLTPTPYITIKWHGSCCRRTPIPAIETAIKLIEERTSGERICGELITVTDQATGFQRLALLPCNGSKPYILEQHPMEILPYYQFHNVRLSKINPTPHPFATFTVLPNQKARQELKEGQPTAAAGRIIINDSTYGILDEYITGFQYYIGIQACNACGLYGAPPTWTHAPKFSYTPSPTASLTHTPTPVTPSSTPTPKTVTPTKPLSEIIFGTPLPSSTVTPSQTLHPTATATPAGGFRPGEWCTGGAGFFLLSSGLAALVIGLRLREGN